MKKLIFIVILMGGVAFGQLRTVNQAIDTFVVKMEAALSEIQDLQTQINTLRVRILALENVISNADTSLFTVAQIDSAVISLANCDTSKYTVAEIDSLLGKIR